MPTSMAMVPAVIRASRDDTRRARGCVVAPRLPTGLSLDLAPETIAERGRGCVLAWGDFGYRCGNLPHHRRCRSS